MTAGRGARTVTAWWPGRRRFAALAMLTAVATAASVVAAGGSGNVRDLSVVYVAFAAGALFYPAMITVQVALGQVLVGILLVGGAGASVVGPGLSTLLPIAVVAGVVATAELLAVVAQWDTPLPRAARGELSGALRFALTGGAVFAVVWGVGLLPGPGGPIAVGLAAGACAVLATLLVRRTS